MNAVEYKILNRLMDKVTKLERIPNKVTIQVPQLFDDPLNKDIGNNFKESYERAVEEIKNIKEKAKEQDRYLEQLIVINMELENKLSHANQELEDQKCIVYKWKMKVLELKQEMNYLKELTKARNKKTQIRRKKTKNEPKKKMHIVEHKSETEMKKQLELEPSEERQYNKEIDKKPSLKRHKKYKRKMENQAEKLKELALALEVETLKQNKLELKLLLQSIKQVTKQMVEAKEEKLEEVHCNVQKKIKSYERYLEKQQNQRLLWLRDKEKLEKRLQSAVEKKGMTGMTEPNYDALEEKVITQQLKSQLEDFKLHKIKSSKSATYILESEKIEIQSKLEGLMKKLLAEERAYQ